MSVRIALDTLVSLSRVGSRGSALSLPPDPVSAATTRITRPSPRAHAPRGREGKERNMETSDVPSTGTLLPLLSKRSPSRNITAACPLVLSAARAFLAGRKACLTLSRGASSRGNRGGGAREGCAAGEKLDGGGSAGDSAPLEPPQRRRPHSRDTDESCREAAERTIAHTRARAEARYTYDTRGNGTCTVEGRGIARIAPPTARTITRAIGKGHERPRERVRDRSSVRQRNRAGPFALPRTNVSGISTRCRDPFNNLRRRAARDRVGESMPKRQGSKRTIHSLKTCAWTTRKRLIGR